MQTIYSGGFILLFLCPLLLAGGSNPLSRVYSICIRKMQSHWIPGHEHATALHRYRNQKNRQQREGEIPLSCRLLLTSGITGCTLTM